MTPDKKTALLTLNAGSSSLKFRLFALDAELSEIGGGSIDGIGAAPAFRLADAPARSLPPDTTQGDAVNAVLSWIKANTQYRIAAVAHRIVHGGPDYDRATELTPDVMRRLETFVPLAPLHQPDALNAVALVGNHLPGVTQYGCFDTAFHAHQDRLATEFALPASVRARGVRRYGFHGLSYAWIRQHVETHLPHLHDGRVVVAHLGNGASLCAMLAGRSIDTTMGLTALDGLPMGTRCGAIDPGVVLYLQKALGLSVDAVEALLYRESGLKGLSGISSDVKTLMESADPQAIFALSFFAAKTAQYIATMAVRLGGMDGLIFTGGIGAHAVQVREAILSSLAWLPPFEVHVVAANEERAMALEVASLLRV